MEKKRFERPFIKKLHTGMPNKFGLRTEYEPMTDIDGFSVRELMKQYGSPLFILSEKTIRNNFQDAFRAFNTRYPKVQFAWSYKTNYLSAVTNIYHSEGSWAEVVSDFEYDKAISNGVPGPKIIFNGPCKSKEYLKKAIHNGSYIHIDHFDELYTILELTGEMTEVPKVAIRVNMDTGIYPQWTRFGFNYENGEAWEAISRIMISKKMELVGLHCHIGTYILSPQAYAVAAGKLAFLSTEIIRKFRHTIKYIDLGGGFASKNTLKGSYLPGSDTCPSFDQYADAISSAIINSPIDPENLPLLILETGRALIDDAGYLATSVVANKRLPEGKLATIIDAGVNLLFTSFWYDHKITPAQPFSHHTEDTVIYGPLCMNIDIVRENVQLPPMKKGDHLIISHTGAYNTTQWMQFIHMRPKIILIDTAGKVHIVRENENMNSVSEHERIPEHLSKFEL